MNIADIRQAVNAKLENEVLNALFRASWPSHAWRDFSPVLARSFVHVSVWIGDDLIGFVNVATDGGEHAFLLDTTVHPMFRRRGIGVAMVRRAMSESPLPSARSVRRHDV